MGKVNQKKRMLTVVQTANQMARMRTRRTKTPTVRKMNIGECYTLCILYQPTLLAFPSIKFHGRYGLVPKVG